MLVLINFAVICLPLVMLSQHLQRAAWLKKIKSRFSQQLARTLLSTHVSVPALSGSVHGDGGPTCQADWDGGSTVARNGMEAAQHCHSIPVDPTRQADLQGGTVARTGTERHRIRADVVTGSEFDETRDGDDEVRLSAFVLPVSFLAVLRTRALMLRCLPSAVCLCCSRAVTASTISLGRSTAARRPGRALVKSALQQGLRDGAAATDPEMVGLLGREALPL
jgi:hypothetical protein